MAWAIALLIVGGLWIAGPAFADEEDPDCGLACIAFCEEYEGCESYIPGGVCFIWCMDGTTGRCSNT